MKTNSFFTALAGIMLLAAGMTAGSCSTGYYETTGDFDDVFGEIGSYNKMEMDGGSEGGSPQGGNTQAGIVTAGEWSDLNNWQFWSKLMTSNYFADKSDYWQCFTNHRVCVKVRNNSGMALAGVNVKLVRKAGNKESVVWETVTDNHGMANCWVSPWQMSNDANAKTLYMNIDGQLMKEQPTVCQWDSTAIMTVNQYAISNPTATLARQADIAFVVDATGSMNDEITFLKSDLLDIIGKVQSLHTDMTLRTAALFYRDNGDEYLTRHSDFTTDVNNTASFVNDQTAAGGDDYPEAVDTALEHMLSNLSWNEHARTRIAFLILDAPAHHETAVIHSLQESITACAKRGIRLIPVAASGVDKNTEFMLRFFAIVTGGTYTFITDHSGVGYHHIDASVGEFEVEQLNKLIIRLINYYTE